MAKTCQAIVDQSNSERSVSEAIQWLVEIRQDK